MLTKGRRICRKSNGPVMAVGCTVISRQFPGKCPLAQAHAGNICPSSSRLAALVGPSVLHKVTRISASLERVCILHVCFSSDHVSSFRSKGNHSMPIPITTITTTSPFGTWDTQVPELDLCNLLTPRSPAFLPPHVPNKIAQTHYLIP